MRARNSYSNYSGDPNNHDPTNADATPPYANVIGWGTEWPCSSWIAWHKSLKTAYGKEQADAIWMAAWDKQPFMSSDLSWCKYSATFNNYCKDEGLGVSWILPDIIASGETIASNAQSALKDTSKGAENLAKFLKIAIPVAGGLTLIAFGYWGYKKFLAKA